MAGLIGTATSTKDGLLKSIYTHRTFNLLNNHIEIVVPKYAKTFFFLFTYDTGAINMALLSLNSYQPNLSYIHYFGTTLAKYSIYSKDNVFYIQGKNKENSGASITILPICDNITSINSKSGLFDINDANEIGAV